jgi:hypothetical protein
VSCGQNQGIITKTIPEETWTRNQQIYTNEKRTIYSNVFQTLTNADSTYYLAGTVWAMIDATKAIVKSTQSLSFTNKQHDIQGVKRTLQDMTIGSIVPDVGILNGEYVAVDADGVFWQKTSNNKLTDVICDYNFVSAASNLSTYSTKTGRYVSPVTIDNSLKRSFADYIRALVNPQTAKIIPTFGAIGGGTTKYVNTAVVEFANYGVYTWDTATLNESESGGTSSELDAPASFPYPLSNKYKIHARVYRLLLEESDTTTGFDFRIAVPYTSVLTLAPKEAMPSPNYLYKYWAVYNRGGNFPAPVHTLPFPNLSLVYQNGTAFLARNTRTVEEFFTPTNSFYQQGTITEGGGAVYPVVGPRILEGTNDDQMIMRALGFRSQYNDVIDGDYQFYYEIRKGEDTTALTLVERGDMTKTYESTKWSPNPTSNPNYDVWMETYEKTLTLPVSAKGESKNSYWYWMGVKLASDPYPYLPGVMSRWSQQRQTETESFSNFLSQYKNIPAYGFDVPGQVIFDNAGNAHSFPGISGKIFDLTKYRAALPQNVVVNVTNVATEVTASNQKYLKFDVSITKDSWGVTFDPTDPLSNPTVYVVVRRRSDGRFLQIGTFDVYNQRATWTNYAGVWGLMPVMLYSQQFVDPTITTSIKPLLYGMTTSPDDTYDVEVVFYALHENIFKASDTDFNEIKVSTKFTFTDP